MKKSIFFLLFLFGHFIVFGQLSVNKATKDKKKYIEAENKVENYDYSGALVIYKELLSSNPDDYFLYSQIGYCYMQLGNNDEAIKNLQKSVDLYKEAGKMKKTKAQQSVFYLAEAYYMAYDFDKAKEQYELLLQYSNKKQKEFIKDKINQCDYAKTMYENPKGFFVYEPAALNTKYPDYCAVATADQSRVFFTSRRPGSTGGKKDIDGYYFEDIYYSDYSDGTYSEPKNIGKPINSDEHEATLSISPDGKELFIYKSTYKDPGDIYYSKLNDDGTWSEPVRLDKPINTKHNETHASLSPDGKHLYFTSDRNGGEGGLDIYVADKDENGNWTNVRNLGENINSKGDEEGTFISTDGKILYFSSNGRQGMGGYDIFKSEMKEDGTWGTPENMGFPLNTVNDDLFYVPIANNASTAYYSSKQISGIPNILVVENYENTEEMIFVKGYTFDTSIEELENVEKRDDLVKIGDVWYPQNKLIYDKSNKAHIYSTDNQLVMDTVCDIPANTKIKVYQIPKNEVTADYTPTQRGKYGFPINPISENLAYFSAPRHIYDILHIEPNPGVVVFNAELDTMITGQIKAVKYTEYPSEYDEMSPYQKAEFDRLAEFMDENQDVYVDISTFGYKEAPESFDEQRQKQIVEYLINKGVDSTRIFTGLSPNTIRGQLAEYTIYDSLTLKKAIDDKNNELLAGGGNVTVTHGILVTDVTFDLNKADNPKFYNDLDIIAEFLVNNRTAKIGVYGYTDTQGNPAYNKRLSQRRADFVKNYLINKGANPEQIVAEGRGYSKQISKNKDNEGNYVWNSLGFNRRVEIEVLAQGENQKLFVKPVDVPEQYKLNIAENNKYSVNVVISETPIPTTAFDFNVTELVGIDGLYNYLHGEFDSETEAKAFVRTIKDKYPKAFVFISNYRK